MPRSCGSSFRTLGTPTPPRLRLLYLRLHFYSFSPTNSVASRPSAVAAVPRNIPGDCNETQRRQAAHSQPNSTVHDLSLIRVQLHHQLCGINFPLKQRY